MFDFEIMFSKAILNILPSAKISNKNPMPSKWLNYRNKKRSNY